MADPISIDAAARGFLRLRLLRTLGASAAMLLVVWLVLGVVPFVVMETDSAGTAVAYAVAWFLVVSWVLVTFLPLGLALDLLPRRLTALGGVLLFGGSSMTFPLVLLAVALPGIREMGGGDPMPAWREAFLGMTALVGFFGSMSGLGWAWWQLVASRESFLAARGWSPTGLSAMGMLWRYVGLPSFLAHVGRGVSRLTLVHLLIASVNAGLWGIAIVPFFAFGSTREDLEGAIGFVLVASVGVLLVNLLGVGRLLTRGAVALTTSLYQSVREWDGRRPMVFLRSFEQDDVELARTASDPVLRVVAGVGEPRTLDELLLEQATPYGPVIAIGDPRDPIPPLGAARIFVEDEGSGWQDVVRGLVARARLVVLCPGESEGVQWELAHLRSLPDPPPVVFVANPELDPTLNARLFAALRPDHPVDLDGGSVVAAFDHPEQGWTVVTSRHRGLEAYGTALNLALQATLGLDGFPLRRPR
ncbi:MAG: hypothetical protein AAF211_21570 [Myxococcota bacterium]